MKIAKHEIYKKYMNFPAYCAIIRKNTKEDA